VSNEKLTTAKVSRWIHSRGITREEFKELRSKAVAPGISFGTYIEMQVDMGAYQWFGDTLIPVLSPDLDIHEHIALCTLAKKVGEDTGDSLVEGLRKFRVGGGFRLVDLFLDPEAALPKLAGKIERAVAYRELIASVTKREAEKVASQDRGRLNR
jgi:hypothetical protein